MRLIRSLLCLSATALVLSACAGTKIKNQVTQDLQAIADQQDCETTCTMLKMYIRTKLAGL